MTKFLDKAGKMRAYFSHGLHGAARNWEMMMKKVLAAVLFLVASCGAFATEHCDNLYKTATMRIACDNVQTHGDDPEMHAAFTRAYLASYAIEENAQRDARQEASMAEALRESAKAEAAEKVRKKVAAKKAAKPGVTLGMSTSDVVSKTSWGRPDSINRTTTRRGVSEQWVYGHRSYLYFEDGILTAVQN